MTAGSTFIAWMRGAVRDWDGVPDRRYRHARAVTIAALTIALALPGPLAAQSDDYAPLRWWHPLAAAAGVGVILAIDQPVHDFVQDHRSGTLDDVAKTAAYFHKPEVFLVSGVGAMSVGLLIREPKVAETGLQIIGAYGLSSAMMIATKWTAGRSRPSETPDDNTSMDWFHGGADASFPSGASAVMFSLATTVADAVDHPAATVVLYTGATLNAWSRVNDDKHWLSDVALGALYGVTAAKLVNGRWRILGFRPPTVGVASDGFTIAYTVHP